MTERTGAADSARPFMTVQVAAGEGVVPALSAVCMMSEGGARAPALFFELTTRTIRTYVLDSHCRGGGISGGRARLRRFRGGLSAGHLQCAKSMLSTRDHNSVTLVALGNACGLSPSHFAREFKKSTGLPPHRWALKYKVSMAKDMLLHSPLSLAEIATECGFVDHSHLGRWFKRMTGVSPKAWQRFHLDAESNGFARAHPARIALPAQEQEA